LLNWYHYSKDKLPVADGQVRSGLLLGRSSSKSRTMSESHKAASATSEVTSLEYSYARIIRDDTAEPTTNVPKDHSDVPQAAGLLGPGSQWTHEAPPAAGTSIPGYFASGTPTLFCGSRFYGNGAGQTERNLQRAAGSHHPRACPMEAGRVRTGPSPDDLSEWALGTLF
jgi:hypothetical protein